MAEGGASQCFDHVHVDLAVGPKGACLAEEPREADQVVGGVERHWEGKGRRGGEGGESEGREGRVRASRGTHTHRLTIASFHDLPHLIGHQVSTVSWHHLIVRSSAVVEVGGADLREALVRREVGRTCSEEQSS